MLATSAKSSCSDPLWSAKLPDDPRLRAWLAPACLLTPDLRSSLPKAPRLTLIGEGYSKFDDSLRTALDCQAQDGWQREIQMHLGADLLVHAHTYVPRETCDAHPWLTQLGDRALGDGLLRANGARREQMLFAPTHTLAARHKTQIKAGWSRRSIFMLDEHPFLLIEHFSEMLAQFERIHEPRRA